jgi:plastocyanin
MSRLTARHATAKARFVLIMLSHLTFKSAGALEIVVRDQHGQPLGDAIVFATRADVPSVTSNGQAMIDQIGKQFSPRVSAVAAGTVVSFPNKDDIKHHVYSFSPAKVFQLKLYHGVMAEPVLFDKPGLVTLGCNIHDGMIAYLYVVDSPHFGLTAVTGTVQLPDLVPGEYVLTAWHYQMIAENPAASQRVTVTASSPTIELSLALSDEQQLPPPLE